MNRARVYCQTFGPGEGESGARFFRDEVVVCHKCNDVVATRALFGNRECLHITKWGKDRYGNRKALRQCDGTLIPPSTIVGWRYLAGRDIR